MSTTLLSHPQARLAHRVQSERAFRAIFPPRRHVLPTPQASPYIGAPPSPVAGAGVDLAASVAQQLTQHEAAWSLVTRWLSISTLSKEPPPHADAALDALIEETGSDGRPRELIAWFNEEVRRYFSSSLQSDLAKTWTSAITTNKAVSTLESTAQLLSAMQREVLRPVDEWLAHDGSRRLQPSSSYKRLYAIEQLRTAALYTLHAAVRRTVPREKLIACLSFALMNILQATAIRSQKGPAKSTRSSLRLMALLHEVGLGGDIGQKALAFAVQETISSYVDSYAMRVDWITQQTRVPDLQTWVANILQPTIESCLQSLTGSVLPLSPADTATYQRLALSSLGRSRLQHLVTYVQLWPTSLGAVLDLKEYIALPDAKAHLATSFIAALHDRVAHAGATTAELLGIYVSAIRVFKTLDNRSVLLEKVTAPLRVFLRDREDTVRVIAASFLAELDENDRLVGGGTSGTAGIAAARDEVCVEITKEVLRSETRDAGRDARLDWDDMAWLPDPIDAGPDWKSTRGNDVVSYMLTLFEREVFVKEVQNILGERLLRSEDEEMAMERRLVEILKGRLGADKLQAAEVMVRDMADSVRIGRLVRSVRSKIPSVTEVWGQIPDEGITFVELVKKLGVYVPSNRELKMRFIDVVKEAAVPGQGSQANLLFRNPEVGPTEVAGGEVEFEAKVLSSFFWPELRDDDFKIPLEIAELEKEYETGFKRIKTQRRLRWLSALGRATVEVELTDRTVKVDGVKTWVAAVVYAFQSGNPDQDNTMAVDEGARAIQKTVGQLEEELNMDELLVKNALSFWVGQRVLKEVEEGTFAVLETLDTDGEDQVAASAPVPPRDEAVSALKSQDAVLKDNKGMYEMFMIGMLTNGGAMDASRIAMMMKMVVPGGFNFGEEEVTWLLQNMEGEGRVTKNGDAWAIKK